MLFLKIIFWTSLIPIIIVNGAILGVMLKEANMQKPYVYLVFIAIFSGIAIEYLKHVNKG